MNRFVANTVPASGGRLALLAACLLLALPAPRLHAQTVTAPPRGLQIVILEGEGALNNIQERTAREPIVQVQDQNHKPVAGATVLFALHSSSAGAGGTFANGATTLSVTTDANGIAHAHGIQANQVQGSWQVQVTASFGNLAASTVINELNVVPPPPPPTPPSPATTPPPTTPPPALGHVIFHLVLTKPVVIAGGAIAAGTVVTVVVIKQNISNGTTITPGSPVVGPPAVKVGIRFRF